MKIFYFVKFSNDREPQRFEVENWLDFVNNVLIRYMPKRGYIEWMIRE
jgi:hypothetical protein